MEKLVLIVENGSQPGQEIRDWAFRNPIVPVFMGNGIEALLWLGKGNLPDLILAEAEMGLMPATQFVQYLKASGFFQDIPVLAFGNPSRHEIIAGMMQAGAADYLLRPFGVEELRKAIQRIFPTLEAA